MTALICAFTTLVASPARADDSTGVFTSYAEDVHLAEDGSALITITADFDPGTSNATGPTFVFRRRAADGQTDGRTRYRKIRSTLVSVTSPTGANTDVSHDSTVDSQIYQIGNSTSPLTEPQRYVMTIEVTGLVTPSESADVVTWAPVVAADSLPHDWVVGRIMAPQSALSNDCLINSQASDQCTTQASEAGTYYTAQQLAAGYALVVTASYPAGTFTGVKLEYTAPATLADRFPLSRLDLIGALVILVAGVGAVVGYALLHCRDRRWDTTEPGIIPADKNTKVVSGKARRVPMRFEPPQGVRPAEVAMLINARPEDNQISATLVDLAVRGFLTIHHEDDGAWTFRRNKNFAGSLEFYERTVLKKLFPKLRERIRTTTSTRQVTRTKGGFTTTREGIERRMTEEGWFYTAPDKARGQARKVGTIIGLLGLVSLFPLGGLAGLGMWSISIVIVGLSVLTVMPLMPSRTPLGSAVRDQAEGFRAFLGAGDPELIDWKNCSNIFSRYLPWAIALGVSQTWIHMFQELTDEGRYNPQLCWYERLKDPMWHTQGFIEDLNDLVIDFEESIEDADHYAASVAGSDVNSEW